MILIILYILSDYDFIILSKVTWNEQNKILRSCEIDRLFTQNCFICKKELEKHSMKFSTKDILNKKAQVPDGMTEEDRIWKKLVF